MVMGVGTDILLIDRIIRPSFDADDPFIRKTYTNNECKQALLRDAPTLYYATRFAGKEAVFKALGLVGERIELNNIEILNDEWGKPFVLLYGAAKDLAEKKGIAQVLISLSYDTDYATAFAIAQSK